MGCVSTCGSLRHMHTIIRFLIPQDPGVGKILYNGTRYKRAPLVELGKVRELDMVFFDANHRFDPTVRYFEACSKKTHASSVFIFDDIHWSKEMDQAWKAIKDHPLSRTTVDLFQCGLVFFDPEMPKQNFILEF